MRHETFHHQYHLSARTPDILAWLHSPPLFCWAKTKTTPILCNASDPSGGPYDWTLEAAHIPMTWRTFFQFPSNGLIMDMQYGMLKCRLHSEWMIDAVAGHEGEDVALLTGKVSLEAPDVFFGVMKRLMIDWISKRNNGRLVKRIQEGVGRSIVTSQSNEHDAVCEDEKGL
ncbi:hypothetical protein BDZ90DRAFT_260345 [Jaminaea rosea]|uniref:Uncharacterized protein n=1 Tax=Jaminaea rosea TaxID=1569628 RepID=A0A316USU0_9BASI|nr:hypothetical protein BDZ90DRAFT_260345 [Jaminaea rosea]PWN27858.1 hypothetical protein BDZ90DRAFT_260345 [Jaminaea rosea]